ncbi:hypothetical protein [Vibrio harveyi]|uniref:hypothetical protein n=1 Tax=Vibrio harveyi TaxID=669 RepID=UPI0018F20B44|nr:hypothetical protein [Vibrio harveyi]
MLKLNQENIQALTTILNHKDVVEMELNSNGTATVTITGQLQMDNEEAMHPLRKGVSPSHLVTVQEPLQGLPALISAIVYQK